MAPRPAPELTAARDEWTVWSVAASLVVDDPGALPAARAVVDEVIREIGDACDRFRPDSELSRLGGTSAAEAGVRVSPLLAELVATALSVAADTDGSVDPTLGLDLAGWGYDRDVELLPAEVRPASGVSVTVSTAVRPPRWMDVAVEDGILTVPSDLRLDLGATAKAFAVDRAAARIAAEVGTGVLVSLGGDIATAGPTRRGGWEVLVRDLEGDPAQQVFLPDGSAIATSSTQKRRWARDGRVHQHILDPGFGTPVIPAWRSATVAAADCVAANALSTAAIVRGRQAPRWLAERGAAARLVDLEGRVVTTAAWPDPEETAP
ncbi:FAD:protein FMN transferase [Leifsonia xyli]|uniref:FAD:protein FMN transferase n=1 Tax=Leifsonia xyli TaxID=1575 RepID=UPI003D66E70A